MFNDLTLLGVSGCAPCPSSSLTTPTCPIWAAIHRGDAPSDRRASSRAPPRKRHLGGQGNALSKAGNINKVYPMLQLYIQKIYIIQIKIWTIFFKSNRPEETNEYPNIILFEISLKLTHGGRQSSSCWLF